MRSVAEREINWARVAELNNKPRMYALSAYCIVFWKGTPKEFDHALDELDGLPVRIRAALLRDGYYTRQSICSERDERLLTVRNFGVGGLKTVRAWCKRGRHLSRPVARGRI